MAVRHNVQNHLDFQLKDYLPYQVSLLAGAIRGTLRTEIEEKFSLSIAEWRVMNTVGAFSPLTTKTISDHTTTGKAEVSRAITRLVAEGILIRVVDPRDKRKVLLWFSDKGLELHRRLVDFAIAWEVQWTAGLSDEEAEQTSRLLSRLLDSLTDRERPARRRRLAKQAPASVG